MPERTPIVKAAATKSLGAEIRLQGHSYDDAFAAAKEFQRINGGIFIHPFADPDVVCGQGTVGLEIMEQIPNLGMIIVPIGGGGLISGVACAIKESKPEVKIIGVQTKAFPAAKLSLAAGKIVKTGSATTIADGIAVKQPSELTMSLIKKYVDDIVLVDEDAIATGVMDLMERDHLLAEGCGAVTSAALQILPEDMLAQAQSKAIVCIVSGGNIDVTLLGRITTRGLIHSGRMMRLSVKVEDRPGKLAELLNIISSSGANLIEVQHNRAFGNVWFDEVVVDIDLETINTEHQAQVQEDLQKSGFHFSSVAPAGRP